MKIVDSRGSSQCEKTGERALAASHSWVTVVNPTNHRLLLQACDNCGVVKSENSSIRRCRARPGQSLVSGRMSLDKEKTA